MTGRKYTAYTHINICVHTFSNKKRELLIRSGKETRWSQVLKSERVGSHMQTNCATWSEKEREKRIIVISVFLNYIL